MIYNDNYFIHIQDKHKITINQISRPSKVVRPCSTRIKSGMWTASWPVAWKQNNCRKAGHLHVRPSKIHTPLRGVLNLSPLYVCSWLLLYSPHTNKRTDIFGMNTFLEWEESKLKYFYNYDTLTNDEPLSFKM